MIASIIAVNASCLPGGIGQWQHGRPKARFMLQFSVLDLVALALFVSAWAGYALTVEISAHGRDSLNARMNRYREVWMRRMAARDMRMVDMQIMAALQNGTAVFAST